jgi:predicted DNA-binding protein (UPF0251 family)/predicted Fe-Mo cluster-binding NifX family protein
MPRPQRCRRVCSVPENVLFLPDGQADANPVVLSVDEYEVIRLVDYAHRTHEQCAAQMDISRTTVTEVYESARYKIADAFVNGKRLMIAGGHYRLCDGSAARLCGCSCDRAKAGTANFEQSQKGACQMKIAVTFENGEIFQHFGHTEQFKLYTVENGQITGTQVVNTNGSGHGALAQFLKDKQVDVLICGGIGGGAQAALAEAGVQLYGGVSGNADAAVQALLDGKLQYNPDVRCTHHEHAHGGHGHQCGDHGCGQHGCHE